MCKSVFDIKASIPRGLPPKKTTTVFTPPMTHNCSVPGQASLLSPSMAGINATMIVGRPPLGLPHSQLTPWMVSAGLPAGDWCVEWRPPYRTCATELPPNQDSHHRHQLEPRDPSWKLTTSDYCPLRKSLSWVVCPGRTSHHWLPSSMVP